MEKKNKDILETKSGKRRMKKCEYERTRTRIDKRNGGRTVMMERRKRKAGKR